MSTPRNLDNALAVFRVEECWSAHSSPSRARSSRRLDFGNLDIRPVEATLAEVVPDLRCLPVESVWVEFSKPVQADSLGYQDLRLTCDGSMIALNSGITFTQESAFRYRIDGLEAFTAVDGAYVLTFNATGVQDLAGQSGAGSVSINWSMDTVPPRIVSISGVTPSPRRSSVPALTSDSPSRSTWTPSPTKPCRLLRDGVPVALDGSVTASLRGREHIPRRRP